MHKSLFRFLVGCSVALMLVIGACSQQERQAMNFTGAENEVKLITLDPGHFHAALVQKSMYQQVDPVVHVYAPEGEDVRLHLRRIEQYNTRETDPTSWEEEVYLGPDYLDRMLREKPGNVVVLAGNNKLKTKYIFASIDAGLNVLADKPMCIDPAGFDSLRQAFSLAEDRGVLLYDIMTERYEITTMMQRELSMIESVFGSLQEGTPENPAVTKESVHHFFKYVSGSPLQRPPWYYDVEQQGEGLVDVTTHLVDLIQWECFPGEIIDYRNDIEMLSADHWATEITREQFERSTGVSEFPDYLQKDVDENNVLHVYANGEMNYRINGVHAKVSVVWNYRAREGGDTHYSIMRGTRSNLIIRQGEAQNYQPELYIEPVEGVTKSSLETPVQQALEQLTQSYPGLQTEPTAQGWHVIIPERYRVGHEAHFAQVTEKYLRFLVDGGLPEWEVRNMLAKYHTTTTALQFARE